MRSTILEHTQVDSMAKQKLCKGRTAIMCSRPAIKAVAVI